MEECREVVGLGVPAVILFGLPENKDATGSEAAAANGAVQLSIEAIRKAKIDLLVMTDVCLCEYTDHGHCGVIENGEVLNDPSVELLAAAALSHARAGADIVAPSDMMDGRVGAIRKKLDENGFSDVAILAYAAKYCSAFYGPFREAAQSAPQSGDRRGYQMDPANAREALVEVALDLEEGADMIMVKPALPYLDIIQRVRERFDVPVAAYNVSGEFGYGESGGGRMDRRKAHRAGDHDGNSARGRVDCAHLPCEGFGALAESFLIGLPVRTQISIAKFWPRPLAVVRMTTGSLFSTNFYWPE